MANYCSCCSTYYSGSEAHNKNHKQKMASVLQFKDRQSNKGFHPICNNPWRSDVFCFRPKMQRTEIMQTVRPERHSSRITVCMLLSALFDVMNASVWYLWPFCCFVLFFALLHPWWQATLAHPREMRCHHFFSHLHLWLLLQLREQPTVLSAASHMIRTTPETYLRTLC